MPLPDMHDALPLLAYKIAPRQFDLSYRFSNISLRDQIVRAQTLVRTLVDTGLVATGREKVRNHFQLLICGAGAAGLAAAKEADALGISFVLVEKDSRVPGGVLRSKAQRYVSTAMYEWPHPNHTEHAYPLANPGLLGADASPLPSLNLRLSAAVTIADFGQAMTSALGRDINRWKAGYRNFNKGIAIRKRGILITKAKIADSSKTALKAMLDGKVSIHGVPLAKRRLPWIELADESGTPIGKRFRFEFVIYAVGFANEMASYAQDQPLYPGFAHTPFWLPDRVLECSLGFKALHPHVAILGSGDGALQDALRCLVKQAYRHPLEIWDGLMDYPQPGSTTLRDSPHVRAALAHVAAADAYTTGGAIWSHQTHMFQSLDQAFCDIIDALVASERPRLRHAVAAMIRTDVAKVTIVTQYGYFAKAYALNRFLVLLLRTLLRTPGGARLDIISGQVTGFDKIGTNRRGARITVEGLAPVDYDLVIIRGGLDKTNPPAQQAGLSGIDTGRAGLGRIPAPIRPVSRT